MRAGNAFGGRRARGDFGTAKDYQDAIGAVVAAGVPPRHLAILQAHLHAPGHSASSAELAVAVGYAGWRAVNFQYGALAHRIGAELGLFQPPRGYWANVLIEWSSTRNELGHARFTLRPEVVVALTRLGLCGPPPGR
jgi:hypothetical protein